MDLKNNNIEDKSPTAVDNSHHDKEEHKIPITQL